MWLIDTSSLKLKYFTEASKVEYAILSHTWDDEEITFQDMARIEAGDARLTTSLGFRKIEHACEIAKAQKLHWCWIDTCCIDKSSSAELSEAINSMFAWYKGAAVCFVYLSDFEPQRLMERGPEDFTVSLQECQKQFWSCKWFGRGWTLQELIAPRHVEFYNQRWKHVGDKSSEVLKSLLFYITHIDPEVLDDSSLLSRLPAARKMSWASSRITTRLEDIAYCLMGIFDVNMPFLYGEGQKAFQRLQEQIFLQTNDLSLFAWEVDNPRASEVRDQVYGLFASSPEMFRSCAAVKHDSSRRRLNENCRIDDNSIEFEVLIPKPESCRAPYLLDLNCARLEKSASSPLWLGLPLERSRKRLTRKSSSMLRTAISRSEWCRNASIQSFRISKYPPNNAVQDTGRFVEDFVIDFDVTGSTYCKLNIKEGLPANHWIILEDQALSPQKCGFVEMAGAFRSIAILPFTVELDAGEAPADLALVLVPSEVPEKRRELLCGIFHGVGDPQSFSFRITEAAHRDLALEDIPSGRILKATIFEDILDELFVNYGNTWGEISPSILPQVARLFEPRRCQTHCFYLSSENKGESNSHDRRHHFIIKYERELPNWTERAQYWATQTDAKRTVG